MDSRLNKMEDMLSKLDGIVLAQDRMIAELKTHIRPYKNSLKFYEEEDIGKIINHVIPYNVNTSDIGVL